MQIQSGVSTSWRRSDTFAVAAALTFPTLLTWTYFVWLAGSSTGIQQAVYTVGKVLQFLFPAAWVFLVRREKVSGPQPSLRGIPVGITFGLAILIAAAGLYLVWFRSSPSFAVLEQQALAKVRDLGLGSPWRYAAMGVFYALAHSFLEEYYWRWFVFGQLRRRYAVPVAILVSSLGFMAHHVVLLATFFGWQSPLTYLFSLAVAVGGAVWAWLYDASRSLIGPWLSHMFVDIAIFAIGYDVVRQLLTAAAA